MTVEALSEMLCHHETRGLNYAVLQKPRVRGRRYGSNAALLPGLNGRICGLDDGRVTIMIKLHELRRWLNRRGVYPPKQSWASHTEEGEK